MLSVHQSKQLPKPSTKNDDVMSFNGRQFRAINTHKISYRVNLNEQTKATSSLIDRGANGGLAGSDVRIIERSDRSVDITGIDGHQLNGLNVVTAAGKTTSSQGPIVIILHKYAYLGQGKTIHSPGQMEMFDIKIDDRSRKVDGKQTITTLEGYVLPIHIRGGLPYIDMEGPTDDDMDNLPHVIMISDLNWDPSILDQEVDLDDLLAQANQEPQTPPYIERRINPDGSSAQREVAQLERLWDIPPEDTNGIPPYEDISLQPRPSNQDCRT